jgi:hypothetical protein
LDSGESDFWTALEYRISSEFSGFDDEDLRRYWCDGLIPDEYDLTAEQPCIRGRAFCGHDGQQRWRFTLLIRTRVQTPAGTRP